MEIARVRMSSACVTLRRSLNIFYGLSLREAEIKPPVVNEYLLEFLPVGMATWNSKGRERETLQD